MAKKREQGFNATVEGYHQIVGDISSGSFSPIYLLHGEEPYFIDKISSAISGTIPEDMQDFNLEVVYGSDITAAAVMELARTYPMMTDRRVVIVREAQQMSDILKLESYADSPSATTSLVLCHKMKSLDKRSALYKRIDKSGVVFESVPARDYEIKGFLSELLAERGFTIDLKAKELLVEHLGCEVTKIDNEAVKLMNAMPEGVRSINADHVERYVGISKEYNIFELTDALSVKDVGRLLKIAAYFDANPKSAPLPMLLPSIFKYFLSIFSVGMIVSGCRRKGVALPDKYAIAKEANISTPFFVDKYVAATNLYPASKALAILGYIRECDMQSKGIGGAQLSDGERLRELLLKIINY